MAADYELEKRKYVIGGVAIVIILLYLLRLFSLQMLSDDFKRNADSNAFLKRIQYPARGGISDRNGKLLVYNQPAYDVMVVMTEQEGVDTLDLCESLGITPEWYDHRMAEIQDLRRNPGYSKYTQQLFMSQLSAEEFSSFQEKLFRFPGFYIRKRSIRQYRYPYAAHVLGDVGEVSPADIEADDYYQGGDYIGKLGVERAYEMQLRGEKGIEILLRDAKGRIKGKYQNGKFDQAPVPGKDLTLSIDFDLQALGERLMRGKLGSIVAIEPSTGEVLCMVSSPTYDPRMMVGRQRGKNHLLLSKDSHKPLLNRAIMGQYPPGSTFKTGQALTFLQEGINQIRPPPVASINQHEMIAALNERRIPLPNIDKVDTKRLRFGCLLFRMFLIPANIFNIRVGCLICLIFSILHYGRVLFVIIPIPGFGRCTYSKAGKKNQKAQKQEIASPFTHSLSICTSSKSLVQHTYSLRYIYRFFIVYVNLCRPKFIAFRNCRIIY